MVDHHSTPFDEGTQTKLFIYESYLKAWLQVFLHSDKFTGKTLQFFDFFSGPGRDEEGRAGSPVILLDELIKNRGLIFQLDRRIRIYFNDRIKRKIKALSSVIQGYSLPWSSVVESREFADAFEGQKAIMGSGPSLVFLDQNGVKHVDRNRFEYLANQPLTDVIFFFASSYQKRFNDKFSNDLNIPKNVPNIEVHRCVADHFREWAPHDYFVGDYSIKKGSNIYGLVFGSQHWLGMYKFLQIVWRSELGGDANFEMEAEKKQGDLFAGYKKTKLDIIEDEIRDGILKGKFKTDGDVALHCIVKGILPSKVATGIYGKMKRQDGLSCVGNKQPRASDNAIREPRKFII